MNFIWYHQAAGVRIASSALRHMGDGIVDKCDVSCLCVDGTFIRDARPERDGCVGENVSDKGARGTVCAAAAYLPVDATGLSTTCENDFSTSPGRNRAANLKYVDACPIECRNTCSRDPSCRGELVHACCKCLARQINTWQVLSGRLTLAICVRRGFVNLRLLSSRRGQFNAGRDCTRREASHGFDRIDGYFTCDDSVAGVGHPALSDYGICCSSSQIRTNDGVSRSNS